MMELLHDAAAALAPTGVLFAVIAAAAAVTVGHAIGRAVATLAGAR